MLKKLHHVAYRCVDAEQTRRFYVDGLGLRMAAALVQDYVPSLRKNEPHNHIFFEMEDGSFIAFFDVLEEQSIPQSTDKDWAQHLALEVDDHDSAARIVDRLKKMNVEVIGPVNHGICDSWYFYDPNGHRLEIAVRTDSEKMWQQLETEGEQQMLKWNDRKTDVLPTSNPQ